MTELRSGRGTDKVELHGNAVPRDRGQAARGQGALLVPAPADVAAPHPAGPLTLRSIQEMQVNGVLTSSSKVVMAR